MGPRPLIAASWGLFVAALTLAGATSAQFSATAPIPISAINPFADCTFGIPGLFTLNAEVEPWIATNPTDPQNIVVSWQQDRGTIEAARGLVAGVTFDGGRSWESVVVPGLSRCSGSRVLGAADPWFSFSPDGDLYHIALAGKLVPSPTGFTSTVLVNKSFDGGLTWSDPVVIHESRDPEDDKESITADPTNGLFIYSVWHCLFGGFAVCPEPSTRFVRSTDGGQTWEPARVIASEGHGHQILVMPDGTLILAMDGLFGYLTIKHSGDKGATWLPPGDGLPVLPIPRAAAWTPGLEPVRSAELLFDIAVDDNNGNLYVVWQGSQAAIGYLPQVTFSMSVDGGFSWSVPAVIAQTPPRMNPLLSQSFLPSVHVNDGGIVGVTYYDFRNDDPEPTALSDYWFVHCDPASMDCAKATSWREVRITPRSFDYAQAPITGTNYVLFLGDYVGLASAGRDFVTAFPQSRTSDTADVFFSRIAARVEVEIDVKPGGFPNSIKLTSRGVVPVAILGSADLDAAFVDPSSVCFGDREEASQRNCSEAHGKGHVEDVNADGYPDLVLHYKTVACGIDAGDTEACFTGTTSGGQHVEGCDSVRPIP